MRFSGFDDEWKKSNLGNISSNEMYGMNSAAKDYDGFNKYIRITDISETSNKFIPNPLTSPDGDLEDKYKLKKGDIVFARTGASTGKTYLYDDNDRNLYFAGFLIKFHIDNADPKFIFYNTLKEEYLNWVSVMSVRSGQPGINSNEYKKLPIILPSLDEQNKISNFLTSIDKKIDLLERKHQFYQEFKKYLMQQIFTQKLRFTDYIEEWKTIKLKDVGEINTGNTPSTKVNEYYSPKKYLWVTPSDISSKYIFDTAKRLSDEGAKKGRFVKKNSVLVTCIASIGKNCIILEDGYFNQQINSITPSQSFDLDFIYYLIDYNSEKMKNYAGITATPILNKKSFENMKFEFPSFDEQKQISNMLSNIDNKIFAIEELINKTQKFKKGLLQQMFVVRINWRCNFKLAKSPSFNKHLLILKNKIIFIIIE